jgi:hypothetical protein
MIPLYRVIAMAHLSSEEREEMLRLESVIDAALMKDPETDRVEVRCNRAIGAALDDIYKGGGYIVSWETEKDFSVYTAILLEDGD